METKWKRNCPVCNKEIIYKSYSAWYTACKKNSPCRNCSAQSRSTPCANLNVLLEDSNEAFYWIGFLLADGCFSDNRLILDLSIKDKEHIIKFAKFINYEGSYRETPIKFGLACKDTKVVQKIREKFDIKDGKTYNPPDSILKFNKKLLYCLLAGFIDGDGNIRHQNKWKDFFLRIKNHASWLNVLKEFALLITNRDCVKINNSGYAELNITNTVVLQELKKKLIALNIPIMSRKWDIIDLHFISKYTTAKILREKVLELHSKGYRNKDICEMCNTSSANVTKIIKKYGN